MRTTIVAMCVFFLTGLGIGGQTPVDPTTLVQVGAKLPAFTVQTMDGRTIDSAALRGKVVLINFWATWCPPCRKEMPFLQKDVFEAFQGKDFVMVAISRGETEAKVREFLAAHRYTFPMALDPGKRVFNLFATQNIPRNFVVDKEGIVRSATSGYEEHEFRAMVALIRAELER